MFQCKAISHRQWKSSFIQLTRKCAEDCKTDPKLVHILLAEIRSYFDSCSPPHSKFPPDEINKWITSCRPVILQSHHKARGHITCNAKLLPMNVHHLCQSKPKRPARPPVPQPHCLDISCDRSRALDRTSGCLE
jgi:hypothetical protein